jgi:hypothetical protein
VKDVQSVHLPDSLAVHHACNNNDSACNAEKNDQTLYLRSALCQLLYVLRAMEVSNVSYASLIPFPDVYDRSPTDYSKTKDRLQYYLDLAKVAEKGKISTVFFADWYAGFEVYTDSLDPMLSAGHQVGHMDPIPIISAMAAVTETVAFAATASTSYVNPYVLARQFSTLDHLTEGRVGWNIVTSWSKAAANALGADDVVPHDERYVQADENMNVVYKYGILMLHCLHNH